MSMDAVVDACREVIEAREALRRACERRDNELLVLHEGGVPQRQVSGVVVRELLDRGWTSTDVIAAGVSLGNVRLALLRVRRQ